MQKKEEKRSIGLYVVFYCYLCLSIVFFVNNLRKN